MRYLMLALIGLLVLPLACTVFIAPALAPMATDDQVRMYALAVRELQQQTGLALDFRYPMAIDAIMVGQDFSGVTMFGIRNTVARFLTTYTERGTDCQPGQPGCTCISREGRQICRWPDSERYDLRTFDQVMLDLDFTDEQKAQARLIAQVDMTEFACLGRIPVEGAYTWPVSSIAITSCFGSRADPVHGGLTDHYGIDIAAQYGSPVRAAHAGTVVLAGPAGNYGNLVILAADDGSLHTWYAHLSRVQVDRGDQVLIGETIGYVGNTGKSTGNHLHFEMRLDAGARPVDPMSYYR